MLIRQNYKYLAILAIQVFVLTFLAAVQPSYGRVISESASINPIIDSTPVSEEGIVRLTLPENLVRRIVKEKLETPETYLKSVDRLDFDPINRLVIISGVSLLPANIVFDMNDIAGGGDFSTEHKFNISFKLPSAKKLALTQYFSLEVVEFKIDGADYLNGIHRLSQFIVGILINSSFMDWILDVEPTSDISKLSLSEQIKSLINSKGLRFRERTISFKLDLKMIPGLSDYAELSDLRLWNVAPVILKGTQDMIALQVEAGLGEPAELWFDAVVKRGEEDAGSLSEEKAQFYKELGFNKALEDYMGAFVVEAKEQLNFPLWESREQKGYEETKALAFSKLRNALDVNSIIFQADPEVAHDNAKKEVKEFIINRLTRLKKESFTRLTAKNSGSAKNKTKPFLTTKLSQKALFQGIRFSRDFEFANEQMFPELEVVMAPHIPGIILRGVMNMNISVFMEMGLEGEDIEWSAIPWRVAEDVWGSGMPFEASLRLQSFDEGKVGLDVVNFSILSGSEKTVLNKDSGHGNLMATWTKMAIVEVLTTLAIEDPLASAEPTIPKTDTYIQTLKRINEQKEAYQAAESGSNIDEVMNLAKIDIEKNPFNLAGSAQIKTKLRYLFSEVVSYDDESDMMVFKLDPKLISEKLLSSENTVQVWNLEMLYDKVLNQTFVEVAIGDGLRSKNYVQTLFSRKEYADSSEFVGVDETRNSVTTDLIIESNLKNFENFLNKLFTEASAEQEKGIQSKLSLDRAQEYYLIKDLNLSVIKDGQLGINITASHIAKSMKGILGRLFGDDWQVTQKTIMIKASLNISVEKLNKYIHEISLSPNEVFFGDELLKIDVASAGIKLSGDTSILDKIVSLVAGNISFERSSVARKVKQIVIRFLHTYLNDQDPNKNGNTELGGVKINRFAKLLGHNEEILIQLNPHLMGVAFDVRLLENQKFSGVELGLQLKKSTDTLGLHFTTAGNLAAVDKGELLRIMTATQKIFAPFLEKSANSIFEDEIELIQLFDRVVYNSDLTKLSLYHRLLKVMRQYEGVTNIVRPDTSVVDSINLQLNQRFKIEASSYTNKEITGSGAEVMYFLSATSMLAHHIDLFIHKARTADKARNITYIKNLEERAVDLRERFIKPLMEVYEREFKTRNDRILKKGPTDWNHTYYPDALYGENVYNRIKKWSETK